MLPGQPAGRRAAQPQTPPGLCFSPDQAGNGPTGYILCLLLPCPGKYPLFASSCSLSALMESGFMKHCLDVLLVYIHTYIYILVHLAGAFTELKPVNAWGINVSPKYTSATQAVAVAAAFQLLDDLSKHYAALIFRSSLDCKQSKILHLPENTCCHQLTHLLGQLIAETKMRCVFPQWLLFWRLGLMQGTCLGGFGSVLPSHCWT